MMAVGMMRRGASPSPSPTKVTSIVAEMAWSVSLVIPAEKVTASGFIFLSCMFMRRSYPSPFLN